MTSRAWPRIKAFEAETAGIAAGIEHRLPAQNRASLRLSRWSQKKPVLCPSSR